MHNGIIADRKKRAAYAALFLFLIGCILIYLPNLDSGFYFDDHANLSGLISTTPDNIATFIFNAPTERYLAYLSFAPQASAWVESQPFTIKLTNLLIHLLNGLLIWRMSFLLLNQHPHQVRQHNIYLVCSIITGLWLLSPIHVNTVLFSIQRMTLLSASFTLLAINLFLTINCRKEQPDLPVLLITGLCISLLSAMGILCKENSILTGLFIACLLLGQQQQPPNWWKWLFLFSPAILTACYIIFTGRYSHAGRHFSMDERLFTQSFILFEYTKSIIFALPHDIGLFHDNHPVISPSTHPLSAITLIFWPLLLIISILKAKKGQLHWVGITWFLSGHILESTAVPLELYYDHRNYLPAFGLYLSLTLFSLKYYKKSRELIVILFSAVLINMIITSSLEANIWGDPASFAYAAIKDNPQSLRAHQTAATYHLHQGDILTSAKILQYADRNISEYTSTKLRLLQLKCIEPRVDLGNSKEDFIEKFANTPDDRYIGEHVKDLFNVMSLEPCAAFNGNDLIRLTENLTNNPNTSLQNRNQLLITLALLYLGKDDHESVASTLLRIQTHHASTLIFATRIALSSDKLELAALLFRQAAEICRNSPTARASYQNELIQLQKEYPGLSTSTNI